jgi:hypothetical protein
MALINCSNCKKPISDKAKFCVGCGIDLRIDNIADDLNTPKPKKEYLGVEESIVPNEPIPQNEIINASFNNDNGTKAEEYLTDKPKKNKQIFTIDKNDKRYTPYKISNISLVILDFLYNVSVSEPGRANVFAVYISYHISRYIIRELFMQYENVRNMNTISKVGLSIGIWALVIIGKVIILVTVFNFVF